ncbi:DUF2784 domain-containing protein [Mycobacterium spongiae]|uniref:DUF2784 family protein n=1 Tax=Mycobacterium spongiae TaxID=886343 RepID=A0A975K0D9_9MYCO|nr:DUF2784 domain-containing protein [Mycobacterium spongiae]QUR67883.1 DUF2784 family protein [Mycobacterium spongiae]
MYEFVAALVVALVVALHFAFIAYVPVGGFIALRWRRTIWLHLPAVIWGVGIATHQLDCPLTWMERVARARAGMAPLPSDGFIAHYITGVFYPAGWGVGVELVTFATVAVSWTLYIRHDHSRRQPRDSSPT